MSTFRFVSRPPAAVLRVTGHDAATFLQGQFSNDLRRAEHGALTYGFWLSSKGKVMGDSFVLREAPEVWTLVSLSTAAAALEERFASYIVADDVAVESIANQVLVIAFDGGEAGRLASDGKGGAGAICAEQLAGGWLCSTEFSFGFWIGPDFAAASILEYWRARGGVDSSEMDFDRWRFREGIPSIPRDLGPGDLPQEAGIERRAVSLTKGCYLGQEVMARLESMGQVRRRLVVLSGAGDPPDAGWDVVVNGKRVGEVRSSMGETGSPRRFVAFAMIQRAAVSDGEGLSIENDGRSWPVELVRPPLEG